MKGMRVERFTSRKVRKGKNEKIGIAPNFMVINGYKDKSRAQKIELWVTPGLILL